jgi:hypothetical protein
MKQKIKDVGVQVNGKEIELNSFVETLFANTIIGMVSSLRLEQTPKRIEVIVELKSSRPRKPKV